MNPFFGHVPIPAKADPRWIEGLKRRKEIYERLSLALCDYLCVDLNEQIDRADNPQPFPRPPFTVENLAEATSQRDLIQGQLDALDKLLDDIPETAGGFIDKTQRPQLETQLKFANDWIEAVQRSLESADPESGK
jgi:hypothetical protein